MTIETVGSLKPLPADPGGRADAGAGRAVAAEAPQAAAVSDHLQQAMAAAADVRQQLQRKDTQLTIDFDKSLGRAVFRLIDKATGDVVRQIPSKEMVAIAQALAAESKSGVLMRADA